MDQHFFNVVFASEGDVINVPGSSQSDGSISYEQGWGPDYERNLESDPKAKAVSRTAMNGLFSDVTGALQQYQTTSIPEFITAADNGGTPYSYAQGVMVMYNLTPYVSLSANNNTTPGSSALWQKVIYTAATESDVNAGTSNDTIVTPASLGPILKTLGGTLQKGSAGYYRDSFTGFTVVWDSLDLPNTVTTVTFPHAFIECFTVSVTLTKANSSSSYNQVVRSWDSASFELYSAGDEKACTYIALGFS